MSFRKNGLARLICNTFLIGMIHMKADKILQVREELEFKKSQNCLYRESYKKVQVLVTIGVLENWHIFSLKR